MPKTKKVTITLTDKEQSLARNLSVLVLGKENISGLISYLINKLNKQAETKQLSIHGVVSSDFKTVVSEYENNKVLLTIPQILPIHKDQKITIDGVNYEVSYTDWNFDKGIFEVVVWEP